MDLNDEEVVEVIEDNKKRIKEFEEYLIKDKVDEHAIYIHVFNLEFFTNKYQNVGEAIPLESGASYIS